MKESFKKFNLYSNYYWILKDMEPHSLGLLFNAVLRYVETGEVDGGLELFPENAKMAFEFITLQIDIEEVFRER